MSRNVDSSEYPWHFCSVCAGRFEPEAGGSQRVFYRCVTCSDLATDASKKGGDTCLHICSKCHAVSGLYHHSSHCWAKVFASSLPDAYRYKKGSEWCASITLVAKELALSTIAGDESGKGLHSIEEVAHYMPCAKCMKGIYGTRWISKTTRRSFCGDCWSLSEEAANEDVWFMRASIFRNVDPTGPLVTRPVLVDTYDNSKKAPAPRPSASLGFGAPKMAVQKPAPPILYGHNYSDYVQPTEGAPLDAKPAATASVTISLPTPVGYSDESTQTFDDEQAVNMKRSAAYYGDDEDSGASTGGYSDETSTGASSLGYQDDKPAQSKAPSTTPSSIGYSDESGAGGYQEDAPSKAAKPARPAKVTAPASASSSGYQDEADSSAFSGYQDDSSASSGGYAGGYSNESSGGYQEDVPKPAVAKQTGVQVRISRPGASSPGQAQPKQPAMPPRPMGGVAKGPAPATPKSALQTSSYSGGYSDDVPAPSPAKVPAKTTGYSSGYSDDVPASSPAKVPAKTTGYSGGYSDEAPRPSPAKIPAKATGYAGGYSDAAPTPSSGYSAGYSDDAPAPAKIPPSMAAKVTSAPSTGYSAGYSDESPVQKPSPTTSGSSGYSAGYSDDAPPASNAKAPVRPPPPTALARPPPGGYSDDSTSAGYTGDASVGYSDDTPATKLDPFKTLAKKSAAAYSGAPSGYSDAASTGYSDTSAAGYADVGAGAGYGEADLSSNPDPLKQLSNNPAAYSDGSSGVGYAEVETTGATAGYSDGDAGANYQDAPSHSNLSGGGRPAVSKPVAPPSDGSRDWNEEFQIKMARFTAVLKLSSPPAEDVLQCCSELYGLSTEFINIAQEIGKTIIEEVSIPVEHKKIAPVNVGGVAGGEKYVQRGIFFKFAIDAFGVYGGDEFAQKAAGHELAGLKAYYNCHIDGLNTPFMLLMDYRGYRLIATTKLPIGSGSLIYGSADGGISIHKDDSEFNKLMEKAAAIINIKAHVVGMRGQTEVLYAPTDIEGHIGKDNRYYVLDTARICPPEPVHKSFTAVILEPEKPFSGSVTGRYRMWDHNPNIPKEVEIPPTGEFWTPWPALVEKGLTTERMEEQIYGFLGLYNTKSKDVTADEFGEGIMYHCVPPDVSSGISNRILGGQAVSDAVNVRASNLLGKIVRGPAILVLRGRKGAQLFNLMRYETVKKSPKPLSSDAFTPFGKHSRDVHNQEVESTFYTILSDTIPTFLSTARLFPHAAGALKAIQREGINTRMIGFLRSGIVESQPNAGLLKSWLLNEMIVRVTKNYLRDKLRYATSKLEPVEPIIVERFNLLLGSSFRSTNFWATEMKAQIVNKFGRNGQALTPEEMRVEVDLRKSINKLALFQLLQSKIGVVFTEEANAKFQVDPSQFEVKLPLTVKDLAKLTVLRKSLLEPDLDHLIIKMANESSKNDPEKLLTCLGKYLPAAESHPAIALQRLHIAEKLLIDLTQKIGFKYQVNSMYTSNVSAVTNLSESSQDYLAKSKPKLDREVDQFTVSLDRDLERFLLGEKEYGEIKSHLEVLRLLVESTPFCPLEISSKLFYLRGCLAIIHRLWSVAEAYLRTAYDCITRLTTVPGEATKSKNNKLKVDNERPFSLLILDKLVHVMKHQERDLEALAYAEMFIQQLVNSSFPGRLEDLAPLFGPSPPISFSVFRTHEYDRGNISGFLDPFERSMAERRAGAVDAAELEAWRARVSLTNFDELSGFFMNANVLQHYLDQSVFVQNIPYPQSLRDVRWKPADRVPRMLSASYILPPILCAGTRDVQVHYSIKTDSLVYSGDGPWTLVLVEDFDFNMACISQQNTKVSPQSIVAAVELPNLLRKGNGLAVFRQVTLKPGTYTALAITAKNLPLGGWRYITTQTMNVIPYSATKQLVIGYDRSANWWNLMAPISQEKTKMFAVFDSSLNKYDGKISPALLYSLDERGKVWKCDAHNYSTAPVPLLLNQPEELEPVKWTVMNDLYAFKVSSIAVSSTHSLFLTEEGEVFSLGTNKHGALGHGDTVTLTDPRLIRKLKGKPITKVFTGEDRSAAIDEFGALYQWGQSFTNLPEVNTFFNGTSKAAKGKKRSVAKVVFQAWISIESRGHEGTQFFKNKPIAYITTEGRAYLWCDDNSLFKKDEFEPELVTLPRDPIVDVAMTKHSIAFVTSTGQVHTAGGNKEGELGAGMGNVTREMPSNAFRKLVPYGCAAQVVGLTNHHIIRIDGSHTTFYALSDNAELFAWGGGINWAPEIPPAVSGLKVATYSAGLRGLVAVVDQTLTLPLEHHPLEVPDDQPQVDLSASTGLPMKPAQAAVEGTFFNVRYNQLDDSDFSLLLTIPKTELGSDYHIRIVRPDRLEPAEMLCERGLPFRDSFECEFLASYSRAIWGVEPVYVLKDTNPPIVAGDYQALIGRGSGDSFKLLYRSKTFSVRASQKKYTIKASTKLVSPRQKIQFTLEPFPKTTTMQYVIIRNKDTGMFTGMVTLNKLPLEFETHMTGHFIASWEYTKQPQQPPMELYSTIEFEVGEPYETRAELELTVFPGPPYYKAQTIAIDYEYKKNKPAPGVQCYGGIYPAATKYNREKLTAAAFMTPKGGFAQITETKGSSTVTLPDEIGDFEFRASRVDPGAGMITMKAVMLSVSLEKAPEEEPAPAPVAAPAAAPSTPTPTATVITGPLVITPGSPMVIVGGGTGQASPAAAPASPAPVASPSVASVTEYASWEAFFKDCGIDQNTALIYGRVFTGSSLPLNKLHVVDTGMLALQKITSLPHQLLILDKVHQVKTAQLKKEMQGWIEERVQEELAKLAKK